MRDKISKVVMEATANFFHTKKNINFTEETDIIEDLGGDSLDAMEVIIILEDELEIIIPDKRLKNARTLGDIVDVIIDVIENPPTDEELMIGR
jgi:acyl carrier protein